jgi:hypothetical protein
MALIECPECKNPISDKAIACPGCGYPLAEDRRHSTRHEFSLVTPLVELAAMAEGFAGALREALNPERERPGKPEQGKKAPDDK